MIAAVALTLILPVAGLIVSLALITLLRAADHAQSALAVRRSVRGPRASDLLVVVVTAPLTVARALLTEALIAPLAFAVGAAVYIVTLALTRSLELPGPARTRPRPSSPGSGGRWRSCAANTPDCWRSPPLILLGGAIFAMLKRWTVNAARCIASAETVALTRVCPMGRTTGRQRSPGRIGYGSLGAE